MVIFLNHFKFPKAQRAINHSPSPSGIPAALWRTSHFSSSQWLSFRSSPPNIAWALSPWSSQSSYSLTMSYMLYFPIMTLHIGMMVGLSLPVLYTWRFPKMEGPPWPSKIGCYLLPMGKPPQGKLHMSGELNDLMYHSLIPPSYKLAYKPH